MRVGHFPIYYEVLLLVNYLNTVCYKFLAEYSFRKFGRKIIFWQILSLVRMNCTVFLRYTDPVDVSSVADGGIAILTVLASPEYAGRHGACRITEQVSTIIILYVCIHYVMLFGSLTHACILHMRG